MIVASVAAGLKHRWHKQKRCIFSSDKIPNHESIFLSALPVSCVDLKQRLTNKCQLEFLDIFIQQTDDCCCLLSSHSIANTVMTVTRGEGIHQIWGVSEGTKQWKVVIKWLPNLVILVERTYITKAKQWRQMIKKPGPHTYQIFTWRI